MSELSPTTRDALAHYRASPEWSDDAKERGLDRLQRAIDAGERGPVLADRPASPAGRPRLDVPRTAVRIAVALAAAAAVVLLLRSIDWHALSASEGGGAKEQAVFGADDSRPPQTASPRRPEAPTPKAPAPPPGPQHASPPEVLPAAAPEPAPVAPSVRPAPSRDRATTPLADPLRNEMQLMQRARRALADGDGSRALQALRRHAEDHPTGQMAEDRAALIPQAHCAAGRNRSAAKHALAFAAKYPKSSHRERVAATLKTAREKKCATP